MAISRQIMRYSSPSSSPIFKSLLNQTIRFNHNHQEQEYNKPCDFLGSWEQPKTPREAEKKLGLLRRDYAKQVKELRKEYFYEMELQRQEKQRKDEAKREATLVAKEERKVAKAAMLQVKAAERKASEEELRQTLLKERAEKLEYWRLKNKRVEEKKREKNEIIRCQSSIWIDELNLENKVLEAIVDTTPL